MHTSGARQGALKCSEYRYSATKCTAYRSRVQGVHIVRSTVHHSSRALDVKCSAEQSTESAHRWAAAAVGWWVLRVHSALHSVHSLRSALILHCTPVVIGSRECTVYTLHSVQCRECTVHSVHALFFSCSAHRWSVGTGSAQCTAHRWSVGAGRAASGALSYYYCCLLLLCCLVEQQ